MLDTFKEFLPDSFVVPDYLISVNQEPKGYTVPKVDGITLSTILKNTKIHYDEQIDYIKKVG